MRWWPFFAVTLAAHGVVLGRSTFEQTSFTAPVISELFEFPSSRPWDQSIDKDATGNLVFQSLASLMLLAPNSRYPNGHSIVRATIPRGTVLYHGRPSRHPPAREWLAFDPEHSAMFASGENGTLFTYTATRDLKVVYFDGASGNKFDGVVDTQDILFWGETNYEPHDGAMGELERMNTGCAWGKQYGVDGFVRMQLDFELMYCDFSQGLRLVSITSSVAGDGIIGAPTPDGRPHNLSTADIVSRDEACDALVSDQDNMEVRWDVIPRPRVPIELRRHPMVPPMGWKGSLPSTFLEGHHAGSWHNAFPGEVRVRVDPSSMVSFFDPALKSLVRARKGKTREQYRLDGISKRDIARVRADVDEMMARNPAANSGVDWQALARVIQDRFSDRLPYIRYLLHQEVANATAQAVQVRRELLVSLLPYVGRENVGEPVWYERIALSCRSRFTAHLASPESGPTKQEVVLRNAVDEVLHEICRVYTISWRDAFDVEEQSTEVAAGLLATWQGAFDALIEWLDWPVWMKCEPTCGLGEYCSFPQGAAWQSDVGREPRCLKTGYNVL